MSFDVFYRVMSFMDDNKLKPSDALVKEYRLSKTTKTLNLFPSYKKYLKEIGMSEEEYYKLEEVYSRK